MKEPKYVFLVMLENPKPAPDLIYDYCKGKGYFVNLLVNNAGYALPKPFHETPMEDEEKFLRVLGISVVALTKLFIKDMIREKKGKIMMISSVAAFAPPSSIQTLYGPVKTFINRFSEGLNLSYNSFGITSTAICPGYTITNYVDGKLVLKKVPDNLLFQSNGACEYFFYYVLSNKKERNLCSFDIFYYFPHLIISIFLVHHPWFKIRLIAHLAILGFFSTSKINS